jgi:hypothetical protein
MIEDDELKRLCKEAATPYFKVPFQNLAKQTEEKQERWLQMYYTYGNDSFAILGSARLARVTVRMHIYMGSPRWRDLYFVLDKGDNKDAAADGDAWRRGHTA